MVEQFYVGRLYSRWEHRSSHDSEEAAVKKMKALQRKFEREEVKKEI